MARRIVSAYPATAGYSPSEERVMATDVVSSSLLVQGHDRGRLDLSVFHQGWWHDIARRFPGYCELKVARGERTVGRLPFVLWRNRLGLTFGQDPYWAHLGGPIVDEDLSSEEKSKVLRGLIQQLPRRASFSFVCDPTLSYADLVRKALFDAGFEHSSQITYVRLPEDGDVLSERKRKHRGHIKRAAKCLECVDLTANEFVEFFETNLKERGKRSYAPLKMLPQLIQQTIERGCGRAVAARLNTGETSGSTESRLPYDAAIVYIWDDRRCYYWLSTHRVASGEDTTGKPHPDAVKLLMVNAIEHAQSMNLVFDADGVVSPGADHLYRNILGLKIEERRDVFRRLNIVERIYQRSKLRFTQWRSEHSALPA
jgi:hypothetical protein